MTILTPAAFLSYVHSDDDHDNGRISKLRVRLEGEIRMHMGKPFKIFQDRNDLEWGQNWQDRIEASIKEVSFLIPIVTPSYFNSPACRREYELFLERENSLGTNQLIMPIYYLSTDQMSDQSNADAIGISLRSRQYSDWRGLRFLSLESAEISKSLSDLAEIIKKRTAELAEIIAASKPSAPIAEPSTAAELIIGHLIKAPEARIRTDAAQRLERWSEIIRPPVSEEPTVLDIGDPYRIFTTEFDEVVPADQFLSGKEAVSLTRLSTALASELSGRHAGVIAQFGRELARLRGSKTGAVSILLDNSGSLRGEKISYISAWTIVMSEIFDDAGFQTEVIGFTTRAWKGGQSREKWLAEGRPPRPGRLNDVRYIVYKAFDQSFVETIQNYGVMFREGILKENIDGEALIFAKDRLVAREVDIRSLIVVSDGAPVDDSTLSINGDTYLERHLKEAVKDVREVIPHLMAIGVNTDASRYYGKNTSTTKPERIGPAIITQFRRVLEIGPQRKAKKK